MGLGAVFGGQLASTRVLANTNSSMKDDRKYLTEEELKAFLGVIKSVRDRAIFTVMYWRGLRRSEVGTLQLSAWAPTRPAGFT